MRFSEGKAAIVLTVAAVVFFAAAGIFNKNGNWGDPGQAVANISWMLFVASVLALIVDGALALKHRHHSTPTM
jgi:hypothetical protein